MNLTLTLNDEIILLNKYRVTCNELMFIRTLLILQNEQTEDLFGQYLKTLKDNEVDIRDLIMSLQAKQIILKSYKVPAKGQEFDPYEIPVNKNFLKSLYKSSFELGKELFEEYAQFGNINGNLVPLRGVSKHFNSLEDAYFKYGRSISWNNEKHEKIIELVKWGKEHNIINCSLSSFIINQGWLDLEAIKEGDVVNVNYDAIKMV
jgi:hypothetical protein